MNSPFWNEGNCNWLRCDVNLFEAGILAGLQLVDDRPLPPQPAIYSVERVKVTDKSLTSNRLRYRKSVQRSVERTRSAMS
jgi:hypothetical protein